MTNIMKKTLLAAAVPADVQLSDKQELVRGNGAELQSFDPHKIEGVLESNVNRDVLEGLIITGSMVPENPLLTLEK